MTVLETIQRSTDFLARKGVDSARLQAELLLAHVLQVPRMRLYLNFERNLTPPEVNELRELIKRRSLREPLQHILGSASFCGLELVVSRQVLVPRPETELLAELGWNFLNSLVLPDSVAAPETQHGRPSVLDFGTGSGCLAVTLASKCPHAVVYASDISAEALDIARQNAERHGLAERIRFALSNGFDALPADVGFDLIISNPPYIPTSEIAALQPEVREFEPRQALDGGEDGLDFYRLIAAQARARLRPGGKLMLEFGDGQFERIRNLLAEQNWIVEPLVEDYTHRPRIVIAQNQSQPETAAIKTGERTSLS